MWLLTKLKGVFAAGHRWCDYHLTCCLYTRKQQARAIDFHRRLDVLNYKQSALHMNIAGAEKHVEEMRARLEDVREAKRILHDCR